MSVKCDVCGQSFGGVYSTVRAKGCAGEVVLQEGGLGIRCHYASDFALSRLDLKGWDLPIGSIVCDECIGQAIQDGRVERQELLAMFEEPETDRLDLDDPDEQLLHGGFIIKHMGHRAKDLLVTFVADLQGQRVLLSVEWIDTALLTWTMESLQQEINRLLERQSVPHRIKSLDGFKVDLIVKDKARFHIRLVERDFEPRQPTLVMSVVE